MRVLYPGRIGIWRCWICAGRKTGEPGKKPSTSEQGENQQQTQPTCDTGPGIEPRPHREKTLTERSTLTTAPSLLPIKRLFFKFLLFIFNLSWLSLKKIALHLFSTACCELKTHLIPFSLFSFSSSNVTEIPSNTLFPK